MAPGEIEKKTERKLNHGKGWESIGHDVFGRVSDFIYTVLALPDFWVFNKKVRRMDHSNSVPDLEESAVYSKKVKNGKKKILLKIEVLVFKIGEKMILV